MNSIWKKPYQVLRSGEQEISGGHSRRTYTEITVSLDVQDTNPQELMTLPEGDRSLRRLTTYGDDPMYTSDVITGKLADILIYDGQKWKCESCVKKDKFGLLPSYRSRFVLLPTGET